MNKKELVSRHPILIGLCCRIYNSGSCFLRISRRGKNNQIRAQRALLRKPRFYIEGNDNIISVGDFSQLNGVTIHITGSGNTVTLGSFGTYQNTEIYIEGDGNRVSIGNHAHLYGKAELAALEGTSILIGEDFLCSSGVEMRTGDSHSILDPTGRRVNACKDICIGSHVWLGRSAMLLKGCEIGDHCIVGARTLVTKAFKENRCMLAGCPARIIKRNTDWSVHHILLGEIAPDYIPPEELS